jgi:hypothetical protein
MHSYNRRKSNVFGEEMRTQTVERRGRKRGWDYTTNHNHQYSVAVLRGKVGGESPVSNRGDPGSVPSQVMWDLWWTERHRGRFPQSTTVSPAIPSFH